MAQVSIVIPAYNQAHYLPAAIRSARAQTFQDTEIIVVDDGSTDDTATVVAQFGDHVHYIYQENQGLAGARNTGIQQASGEFIALLDSDDEWHPAFLQHVFGVARREPAAVLYYTGAQSIDAGGRDLPQILGNQLVAPEEMYWTLLRSNFLIPSSVVLRTPAIVDAGLFDPAFRRCQDWELWLRLLRAGHTFAGIPKPLVRYRIHDDSLSADPTGGQRAVMALAKKHVGVDDGRWNTWSAEKRRLYGGVYRYHAWTSIYYQGDWRAGATYLHRALHIDPSLADDLSLFYELALGSQPLGYRGTPHQLDLAANADAMEILLTHLFRAPVSPSLAALSRRVRGNAYRAFGLLSYHTGDFAVSRRYLVRALRTNPRLVQSPDVTRLLLSVVAGKIGGSHLRRLRAAFTQH